MDYNLFIEGVFTIIKSVLMYQFKLNDISEAQAIIDIDLKLNNDTDRLEQYRRIKDNLTALNLISFCYKVEYEFREAYHEWINNK